MQYNIAYNVVYDVVGFRPSSLEALKMARASLWCWTMHFSLHSHWFAQKMHDFISALCRCTCRSYVCRTATYPPSDHQFIAFQWQCCAQTTSSILLLSIGANLHPTVPLRGHATSVCVGLKALQVLKPPPPARYVAEKKLPVAPRSIQWGYQVPIEWACTLDGSTGLQHGERPWPVFQDRTCRKTIFSTFVRPMPQGCTYCSKCSAHMPTAWEGVPGWLGQQGFAMKKDI